MELYMVTSSFYDNGKAKVSMKVIDGEEIPDNEVTETDKCDTYIDYYTDKKEAEKAVDEIRRS